ncbi:MAG: serine/threonine protein kinase, partial [Akkermansiaceae bacterium]|nr:serine/threonine protein kinase [Akkermansiaceae bacterium]
MTDSPSLCPDCAAPLPQESPQALCPACLMRQALASRTIVDGDPPASASAPLTPEELGEKFPGYEILECLGRGGMGVVYKARQKSLNRIVAIKILAPERGNESRFAERFAREAEFLAKLNHPHIVTIHDFGVTDSQPSTPDSQPLYYLVMEFVDGVNLRDLIRDGKLEAKQALAIVPPICDALQYAHDNGIVHRDIKPENLLLDKDGRIKIADFGIASLMGEAGEIAGTPPYMAPEQTDGNIDHRADIYALGVVLYEMLTGERPDKELIAPSRKVQIDVRLDEVVLRAMERKPELRFQQATALKTNLEIIANQDASERSAPKMTSHPVPLAWMGYEYRSSRTLLGLPLLHVANGLDPLTGQPRHARGIVAIGGVATGWLAMGGRAYGVFAFGGIAVGVFSLGGVAIGMVSVGGLTLALVMALGGMAIAPFALGGMAIGYLAMGGQAIGVHVVDGRNPDVAWLHQSYRAYQAWLFGVLGSIWMFLLGCSACISAWAKSRALGKRALSDASEKKPGLRGEWALGLFIGAIAGVPMFLGFMGAQEAMVICGLALLLSFVLGVMSWRSPSGKFAALASGLGLLLLVAFTFKFLAPLPPQAENAPGTSSRIDPNPPDFGPVMERVVTYGESLMLKTGTTVHETPGQFGVSEPDQNSNEPKLFLRPSRVPGIKWMLWSRNLELFRLSKADWSKLSVPGLE